MRSTPRPPEPGTRGTGTTNGGGTFGFLLTAIDEQINGGAGADKFRIKIWDISRGGALVYDHQVACGDTADSVDNARP